MGGDIAEPSGAENTMRILFSSIVTAGLLASHLASAQCTRPAEKSAFDVTGLKSQLMVTAISCQVQEKYNAFVVRFRPDLASSDRTLNSYFSRAFGRRGQQEHDDYVTSLANAQSQNGIKAGTGLCNANVPMFDEVMAVKTTTELSSFAASKGLTQPIVLVECAGSAPATTRTAAATSPRHR